MMSLKDIQSPLSSAEFDNFVILFVGFIISTFLYGLTFFQTYTYLCRYPNDFPWTKTIVGALSILDTASLALVSFVLHHYSILMLDMNVEPLHATPVFCTQALVSAILTLITQLFFAGRVYTVCGGSATITSKYLTLGVFFFAFVAFVFGLTSVGQIFRQRRLSAFASFPMAVVASISQGFAAVANIIIFIAMCWSLRPVNYPDMLMPEGVLDNIVTWINSGLGITITQLVLFGMLVASPAKPYWISCQMIGCRVYVNTVLGLLNARRVRHGVGLNVEETRSASRDSTNGGLPSIRFNRPAITMTINQSANQESGSSGTQSEEGKKEKTYFADDENIECLEDKASLSSGLAM